MTAEADSRLSHGKRRPGGLAGARRRRPRAPKLMAGIVRRTMRKRRAFSAVGLRIRENALVPIVPHSRNHSRKSLTRRGTSAEPAYFIGSRERLKRAGLPAAFKIAEPDAPASSRRRLLVFR